MTQPDASPEAARGDESVRSRRALEDEAQFAEFFRRLRVAPRQALLLDFDGTLAPLRMDRRAARMYRGVRSALASLAVEPQRCRVGIVSGRSLADLRRMVRLDGSVEMWGSHGLERFTLDGWWSGPAPARAASAFIDEMLAANGDSWRGVVERKPYGLALHLRGHLPEFADGVRREVNRLWRAPARGAGLEVVAFDGDLEFRPAGVHKGRVIERLFAELGEDAAIAYLGDGRTDEDAFRALRGRGLSVLVGPQPRASLAVAWLRPPEELLSFLVAWGRACMAGGGD